jgi:nitrate reductase gamma subunit
MLHTLFFVLSLLMDSRLMAEAVRNGAEFGLVSAGILCLTGTWLAFGRRWEARKVRFPAFQ